MAAAANKRAAAAARKAEAGAPRLPQAITFEYDGETYTIDEDAVDNLELFEAIEDEKYLTAARGFVGRDQWQRFKDRYRDPVTGRVPMEPVQGFLQTMMEAIGQGNS